MLVFATASLVATLLHTDRIPFTAAGEVARFAAWVLAFGVVALTAYGDAFRWGSVQGTAYLAVLVTLPLAGFAGWATAHRRPRLPPA